MTAAWFHGAAKTPLVISVNSDGTVSPSTFTNTTSVYCHRVILCRFVWICVQVKVVVCGSESVSAELTNQQEVLMYLCSTFSHKLNEWARVEVKNGGKMSEFVCYVRLKWKHSVLPQPHTNQRCLSFPGQNSQLEFYPPHPFCCTSFLSNWKCCFWRDKGGLLLDLNIWELRIDMVKPYLHV